MITIFGYYFDACGKKVYHCAQEPISNVVKIASAFAKRGGVVWVG